ncbi:hypothetical protein DdX_20586 [Ditylenchus destructor]|uniref:Uncharacterized protein n=1 Tax=Ditylenchus destructor TaxID=166010 RepID=A0AAD4MKJ4_9BILA|nr:hypothetical protein DdX_20586 [Ditylenchus destructor]
MAFDLRRGEHDDQRRRLPRELVHRLDLQPPSPRLFRAIGIDDRGRERIALIRRHDHETPGCQLAMIRRTRGDLKDLVELAASGPGAIMSRALPERRVASSESGVERSLKVMPGPLAASPRAAKAHCERFAMGHPISGHGFPCNNHASTCEVSPLGSLVSLCAVQESSAAGIR